jgi:hypothetical protein
VSRLKINGLMLVLLQMYLQDVDRDNFTFYLSYTLACTLLLRRIFGPKRDEVTRKWRKLHNEKLNDFYTSPNIVRMIKSRRMRWAGHIARTGERRGVYRILVGKPEGKRPLGRPRIILRWIFKKCYVGEMDWIDLAEDRDRWLALVNAVMNLRFP